jgi:hypothetical protein
LAVTAENEDSGLRKIRIYSRPGCHLCEQLVEELLPLIRGRLELEVVNIDSKPQWASEFGTRIPVVEYERRFVCQYTLDKSRVQEILASIGAS